ncbi:phytoene/squalene synthase family protein [Acaryochloris marina]|uniref:Squalene and phytoene synthase n=1 Tax=Acaryochloris marina (strain MBIC 11017) TaxID=329726 RepID=B0C3G1_ACAM1|nr:phytoene/squalene synthase family protein [Acaryochloris marina]ABW28660.1 squalene and phytoene synthase [Acaryochloris marina MBIC11017]BDM77655.1 farnesyl-diphosphate farnesyltransferase [Acaryochloris marina MBIC10699]
MVQMALESPTDHRQVERFCQEILPQVSRTFALSIRFLPGNLGRAVLCGYLLARIADTIEDDPVATVESKIRLLDKFLACFDDPAQADIFPQVVGTLEGETAHLHLVENTHLVFALFRSLPAKSQQTLQHWITEMVQGMQKFVKLHAQGIRIKTLEEYQEYCYYVAGTVGYLLTDLWFEHSPSVDFATYHTLRQTCAAFGEGLQTVNILKDIAWDAEHENSIYVPQDALESHGSSHEKLLDPEFLTQNHAAITSLVELAWSDLDKAAQYLMEVPRSAIPIRLFCILPLVFAYATLRDITGSTAMLKSGGNIKISRAEVKSLIMVGPFTVLSNFTIRRLIDQVRQQPFLWGNKNTSFKKVA